MAHILQLTRKWNYFKYSRASFTTTKTLASGNKFRTCDTKFKPIQVKKTQVSKIYHTHLLRKGKSGLPTTASTGNNLTYKVGQVMATGKELQDRLVILRFIFRMTHPAGTCRRRQDPCHQDFSVALIGTSGRLELPWVSGC